MATKQNVMKTGKTFVRAFCITYAKVSAWLVARHPGLTKVKPLSPSPEWSKLGKWAERMTRACFKG